MKNLINLIPFFWIYLMVVPSRITKDLDRRTAYVKNQHINPKLFNRFFFFGFINYLFINKIKEDRKIEHFEYRLKKINNTTFELSEEEKEEKRNIEIYLKLSKIKKRI